MTARWALAPGLVVEARPAGAGRFVAVVVQDRGDGPVDLWYVGGTVTGHTPEGARVAAPSWPLDDIGPVVEAWIADTRAAATRVN